MYLKINGEDTKYYVSLMPCTTQHGKSALKIIGEFPETNKGFKYFNDDDEEVADYSDYTFIYKPNIYSNEQDEFVPPSGSDAPIKPTAFDRLSARVSQLSSNVAEITPYKDSKTAYYGEKEKRFYGVPSGVVTVYFDKYDGEYTVSRMDDVLTVSFPALANETNITIMVQ